MIPLIVLANKDNKVLTKEELRQKRKEAYQKAKAAREADPRYQEMKAKQKEKQREIRKAAYARAKAAGKARKEAIRAEKQTEERER